METFLSLQVLLLSLFSFIVWMTVICIKFYVFQLEPKKTMPPSPRKLPIIGNFHQLGTSPNRSLQALSRKYGPIMLLHLGSIPTLVVSSAEVAREIMKTHDLSFSNRPKLPIINILLYGSKDLAFSPYGEYWKMLKTIVVGHLLSNIRVKSFQKVREKEIGHMISLLEESGGSLVNMSALLVSISNNIISNVALGRTYDGLKFITLIRNFLDMFVVFSIGSYIPWLSWVDRLRGLEKRARKIANEFDEFLEDVIEEHVNKKMRANDKNDEFQDLVDILLDIERDNKNDFTLQRDTLKAIILDIFVAGTDPTFTTLEWTISELLKHPRVMKKLQQEVTYLAKGKPIISEEDLKNMNYLRAVIKETLRLHIPVPLLLPRESTQDVNVMGYDVPSGTQVIINAWAIARDPTQWEDSENFRPERFMNNSIDYNGVNFEWLPYGSGRRGCPGIQFSVAVMELTLANVIYKFDLTLPNGAKNEELDMSEANGIALKRKMSLMVVASPRF